MQEFMKNSRSLSGCFCTNVTAADTIDATNPPQPQEDEVASVGETCVGEEDDALDSSKSGADCVGDAPRCSGDNEFWSAHHMALFDEIKKEINENAKFKGRAGSARFEGMLPQKSRQVIKPSDDPESFLGGVSR